jgi:hypothetical protein
MRNDIKDLTCSNENNEMFNTKFSVSLKGTGYSNVVTLNPETSYLVTITPKDNDDGPSATFSISKKYHRQETSVIVRLAGKSGTSKLFKSFEIIHEHLELRWLKGHDHLELRKTGDGYDGKYIVDCIPTHAVNATHAVSDSIPSWSASGSRFSDTTRQSKYWLLVFDVLQVETIRSNLNSLCDKYIIHNKTLCDKYIIHNFKDGSVNAFVEFNKKLRASTIQNKTSVEITCLAIDMNDLEDYQEQNQKMCLENDFIYSKGYTLNNVLEPKVKELLDNIKYSFDNAFFESLLTPEKKFIKDIDNDYKNHMFNEAKNIKNTHSHLIGDILDYNLITDREYNFINVLRYNLILVDQTDFELFDTIPHETLYKTLLVHDDPFLKKLYMDVFEKQTINVDLSLKKYLYKRIPQLFKKYPQDVNFQNDIESIKWHLDVAPLHPHPINYLAFVHASKTGNIDIINYLLETITLDNTMKYEGAIDNAAKNGHFDIVKKLLDFDFRCTTNAIDDAMKNKHYNIAKYLLENGKKCTIKAIDPTKLLELMFK